MEKLSTKLINILAHLVQTEKYDDLDYRMLVDMYQLMPEDYIKKISPQYCKVYFVGYPNISVEEKYEKIRKNETKWDWTRTVNESELKEKIKVYIQESQLIQNQCEKYNLPFFDFSYDIDKSTNDIVDYVLKDNQYI